MQIFINEAHQYMHDFSGCKKNFSFCFFRKICVAKTKISHIKKFIKLIFMSVCLKAFHSKRLLKIYKKNTAGKIFFLR